MAKFNPNSTVTLNKKAFEQAARQKRVEANYLNTSLLSALRVLDKTDAVNRFRWYGLPDGLDENLIECIIFYHGQGALFYMKELEKFFFLPFSLSSDGETTSLDVYGRFTAITPLPFNGSGDENKNWIPGLVKKPYYDILLPGDDIEKQRKAFYDGCVILTDYSRQISQTIIPRQQLNEPILQVMSECIPLMRTAMIANTGVAGLKVTTEDEQSNVDAAAAAVYNAALTGKPWVPIVGSVQFQELTGSRVADAQQFLLCMQALDSFRLSLLGLDNGGILQKQTYQNLEERKDQSVNAGIILSDSLKQRQDFCNIANSIWGTSMSVEVNETITSTDNNMDGFIDGSNKTNIIEREKEVPKNDASME